MRRMVVAAAAAALVAEAFALERVTVGITKPTGPANSVAADIAYLAEVSRTNVLAARFPMDNGSMACPPQAKRGYRQFFLRDYAYVLEGCADVLPEKDLLDAAKLFLKAISPEGADRISRTLVGHYDGIVQNGQVRHLLPGDYWQLADAPRDTYQNGGFWGTASGWVANAIARTDLPLARRMLADLVRFYREKGVPEWSVDGVGKGHLELEGYLASTTVPLAVFRRMDWSGSGAFR